MKKTLLSIFTLIVYLLGSFPATAEDHKHKLHEIEERIKQAVKDGKITEKEGWAKWHAVLREHGHHEDDEEHHDDHVDHKHKLHEIGERIKQAVKDGKITEKEGWAKWHAVLREHGHHEEEEDHHDEHDDHQDEDEWEEAEELEHEIEIRELEFELERLEHEHEMQRIEWDHERERMERDFDRERREWEIEELDHSIFLDKHRNQLEMQMREGPRPGARPPNGPGPKPVMRRGGPPRGMIPPVSRGHGHGHDHAKKTCDSKKGTSSVAKGKSDCGKSKCKSCCGKGKSGCDKKESCKLGECKKSESCPKKDSSCKKGEKSCPDKKEDCPKSRRK